MLNLDILFSFFALVIMATVLILSTLHVRRFAVVRANVLRAKTLLTVAELRARTLR